MFIDRDISLKLLREAERQQPKDFRIVADLALAIGNAATTATAPKRDQLYKESLEMLRQALELQTSDEGNYRTHPPHVLIEMAARCCIELSDFGSAREYIALLRQIPAAKQLESELEALLRSRELTGDSHGSSN